MAYKAEQHSAYFRRSLHAIGQHDAALQQLNALIRQPVDRGVINALLTGLLAQESAETALRKTRQLVFMALMEQDLCNQADLDAICAGMSGLAHEVTICAVKAATIELQEDFGTPRNEAGIPIDLVVVGMGKVGGNELNVSSDLDLVFLIREQGQTDALTPTGQPARRGSIAASDFAHRVTRRVIELLADITADGYVFRVDTRLRPNGDSGPLVCTFSALELYFQIQGRAWERFAWLKAAVIATSAMADSEQRDADCVTLNDVVQPFVFRRYHDYDALTALREVHDLIQQEAAKRDAQRSQGQDVKLGRGGIREIEFTAQLFQVVRGGRDRGLREPATLSSLRTIAQRELLTEQEVADLTDAYQLLRRCEHMVQYREDQQTHFLPPDDEQRAEVAAMMEMSLSQLDEHVANACQKVSDLFDSLMDLGSQPSGEDDVAADHAPISPAEIDDLPASLQPHLNALIAGPRYRSSQPDTQRAIDSLLRQAIVSGRDELCVRRLITLLETVIRRPAYLTFLDQYRLAFARVLDILSASEWAAQFLTEHPILLDELISGYDYEPLDLEQWASSLQEEMNAYRTQDGADVERQMDVAREWHHAQLFRILARELTDDVTIQLVADELSALADKMLNVAIQTVWDQLPTKFREKPQVAAIAYGRLGGKELGYASDLDLVFLYDDDDAQAGHAYSQLTRRVSSWLSAQTASGTLFEIDLRLRPDGDAGVLVSSLEGFARYQNESAWVWEHQALTRARFSAGDAGIGARFEELRRQLLTKQRDITDLRHEVRSMRQRIVEGHPNRTDLFDLKHDRGGMVDIEFIVQFLVLAHAHQHESLVENVGNIALLTRSATLGLIDSSAATEMANAYASYREQQHSLRLQNATFARVDPDSVRDEAQAVIRIWTELLEDDANE